MNVIWKYSLNFGDVPPPTALPDGAAVLHAGLDPAGQVCLWASVDPTAPLTERQFRIVGTGFSVELSWVHVGTFVSGPYIWHVFEVL